ncbi:MarR family winged helix-turn-helix transcriptional regulator [Sphingomonas sp. LaA6.9]|uniref:MarR family winged helix-turn-helix transcriptional regulator n=1 Tax=Sphingomonas sp. LaA6.9 TaxID=2919914 RepID=UPI001F4FAB96|nr:MarR family winged helix-turn-helix transcriptional regulator [Sphingomonas sp. LaA6.9]MCJ8159919.1 MarR family winged helix-turn-helix transcriptional regulator [Sphingomonas sp. LaA6.9]
MLPTVCVCTKLRRSARAVTALYDDALAPIGLTTPQFALLRALQRTGASPLSTLATATGLDRTTLNRTLQPLETDRLICSRPGADQRVRIIELTGAGMAKLALGTPLWENAQRRMADALGTEHDRLFAILDRIEEIRA